MDKHPQIPKATAKRLPLYYRYVLDLEAQNIDKFSSRDLSESLEIDSATIRRDLAYFGELGKRGYGYDVKKMIEFFGRLLGEKHITNIGIVGVGDLGSALIKFKFNKAKGLKIGCAFDVNPQLVGTKISDITIYGMDELVEQLKKHKIEIVALAVSSEDAQEVSKQLISAGVKGILNFTSELLSVPDTIRVRNVDLTAELQTLIYYINQD